MKKLIANPKTAGDEFILSRLGVVGFLCLALLASPNAAQQATAQEGTDLELLLEDAETRPRVRIAIPRIERSQGMTRDGLAAAEVLEKTLLDDLIYSRIFAVQHQEILDVLELTGDRQHDFLQYRSLGNQVILQATVKEEGGRLALESRVLDLHNYRSVCTGKLYRGTFELARRIAHTYSDEVVTCFSGQPGIALTQIVFTSNRDGFKELYMMDYDGHSPRAISGHKSVTMSPDWSPAGGGIVYASYFSGYPSIYYIDLESGKKLSVIEDGFHNFSPSLSPDGRQVVFTRSLRGNSEIFTIPRTGGELRRITHSSRIDANPAWSSSGQEFAFTSDRSGSPQIYVIDRNGGNLRRVTREGSNNDGADWHPDGTKLAYAHRHESRNRFDIAVIDLITLENRVLTTAPGSHESPSFSPDGQRIAFESSRDGSWHIWTIDIDGRNLRRLTSEGDNYAPSWSSYFR